MCDSSRCDRQNASRILLAATDAHAVPLQVLKDQQYAIETAQSASLMLLKAVSERYDLILLPQRLNDTDGLTLLQQLRKTRATPVVVVLDQGEKDLRLQCLRAGADDVLHQPVLVDELVLRIDAILRRCRLGGDHRTEQRQLKLGDLVLDRESQSVVFQSLQIPLTPIQFKLLWYLVSHQHQVLSKDYLSQLVLDKPFCRFDRSLDMHLSRVRRKLESAGFSTGRLQSVRGSGYVFV